MMPATLTDPHNQMILHKSIFNKGINMNLQIFPLGGCEVLPPTQNSGVLLPPLPFCTLLWQQIITIRYWCKWPRCTCI